MTQAWRNSTVKKPDGTPYQLQAPNDWSQDQIDKEVKRRLGEDQGAGSPSVDIGEDPGVVRDLGSTLGQAWILDPVEGMGEMAEAIPYVGPAISRNVPQGMRDWAARREAEATRQPWQRVARPIADILNPAFLINPAEGVFEGTAMARTLSQMPARTAGFMAGGGALAQRSGDPKDPWYWWKKAGEVGAATLTGLGLGKIAGNVSAGRAGRAQAEQQKFAQTLSDAAQEHAANKESNWNALQKGIDAWSTDAQKAAQQHEAAKQSAWDKGQAAIDKWTTRRDAILDEHAGQVADREKADAAGHQKALDDALEKANAERTAGMSARPASSSRDYLKRIMSYIGHNPDLVDNPSADSLDMVQKTIGDDLNHYRSQMRVDPAAFHRVVDALQRETGNSLLTKSAKEDWDRIVQKTVVDPIEEKFGVSDPIRQRVTQPFHGDDLAQYISQLTNRANQLYKAARPQPGGSFNQDMLDQANGLSRMVERLEEMGEAGAEPAVPRMKERIDNLKRAYRWWSIANNNMTSSGFKDQPYVMRPSWALDELEARKGRGGASLAVNRLSDDDNAMVKWLRDERTAHESPRPPSPDDIARHFTPFKPPDAIPPPQVSRPPTVAPVPPARPASRPPTPAPTPRVNLRTAPPHLPTNVRPQDMARWNAMTPAEREKEHALIKDLTRFAVSAGTHGALGLAHAPFWTHFAALPLVQARLNPETAAEGIERATRYGAPAAGAAASAGTDAAIRLKEYLGQ